jgi:PAS domain-containing protein
VTFIDPARNRTPALYVDPQRHAQFVRLLNEKGVATNFESRVFRLDGEIIWISENARAVCGGNDEIQFFKGTIEDKPPGKLSAGHVYSMQAWKTPGNLLFRHAAG